MIVDPERGHLVTMAIDLFTTGRFTVDTLLEHLTDLGFRMRPTPTRQPRPISRNGLWNLLRDRYYLGEVEYDGITYPGRHDDPQ